MPKINKTNLKLFVMYPLSRSLRFVLFSVALTGVFLYTRAGTPAHVEAAVPGTLNFQARLLTGAGSIVPDGTYNAEFKLYNTDTGGSALWTETRLTTDAAALQVNVRSGYLSVSLGDKTAFGAIGWDQQLYLTMNIGGTSGTPSWDGEMTPRLKLTSVPYAQQAAKANQLAASAGANTGTLSFGALTTNPVIALPDASGTVCLQTSSSCGFVTGSGTAFLQGGNTFSGTTAGTLGTINNGDLNLMTNNTTKLTLQASGNVGIGTAAPTGLLQVTQPTTSTGTVTTNGSTTLTGTNTQFLNIFKVGDTITVSGETERTITAIASNTSLTVSVAFSTTASGLSYTLVGGDRLTVLGNGNVGIGTSNLGNAELTIEANNQNVDLILRAIGTGQYSVMNFSDEDNNSSGQVRYDHTTDRLEFTTNGVVQRAVIDSSGNLGVGTVNPLAQLQVQGASTSSGVTTMTASSGATTFTTSASMTLNAGDYVVPSATTGQARAISIGGTGTSFTVSSAFSSAVTGETFTIHRPITNLTNAAGSSALFVQGSTGNVGIGTSNIFSAIPSSTYKLQVHATSGSTATAITTDAAANAILVLGTDFDAGVGVRRVGQIGYDYANNVLKVVNGEAFGSSSNGIAIDTSGNVGIGTVVPDSVLHTVATGAKSASYTGNLLTNTATSSTASINKYGLEIQSTGTWNGGSANNVGLYVSSVTGGTNNYDAIFNGGGNVGIGDATPAALLTVGNGDLFQVSGNDFRLLENGATPTLYGIFDVADLTGSSQTYTFNQGGLVCTDSGNCNGAGGSLQTSYFNSTGGTTPEIKLDTTRLALDIQDADTTLGATTNLLTVRTSNNSNLGSILFGVQANGNVTASGAIQGNTASFTGADSLSLGTASTNTGKITLYNNANNNAIILQSGTTGAGGLTLTLPTADGSNLDCLKTNGSGGLSFGGCLNGGGSGGGVTFLNSFAGDVTITGTANQVTVANGSNNISLSLPQDIGTVSSPKFAGLTTGAAPATLTTITDNPLTSGATTINVSSTTGYAAGSTASPATLLIESEIVTYTGTTATSFTGVVRGAYGSTAAAHNSGVTVNNYLLSVATGSGVSPKMVVTGNGHVGIGTTAPNSVLHTVATGAKTANYAGNLLTNTATSSTASINKYGLEIQSTGTWNGTSANNIGLYVSSVTGGTNNYDAIFNGGGNVGIGTTAPTAKLQVEASANGISSGGTTMTATNGANTFTTSASITLDIGDVIVPTTSTGQARAVVTGATGTSFTISPTFSANVTGETFTIYKRLLTATSYQAGGLNAGGISVQNYTGRLGIGGGKYTPLSMLSNVATPTAFTDSAGVSILDSGFTWEGYAGITPGYAAIIRNSNSLATSGGLLVSNRAGSATNSAFRVETGAVGSTLTRFLVTGQGNVGIGTDSVGAKLDISNATAANTTTGFQLQSTFAPTAGGTQTNANLVVTNAPTTAANTAVGLSLAVNDSTALANTLQGINLTLSDTGSAAKTVRGLFIDTSGTTNASATVTAALFKGTTTTNLVVQNGSASELMRADTTNMVLKIGTTGTPSVGATTRLFTTVAEASTTLRIGTATDGQEFSAAAPPVYRGTGRPSRTITLTPEYGGAVMTGDGSSNTGSMTSDFCSGSSLKNIPSASNPCGASEEKNYYSWTAQATNDYDIWVRYQVPSDFNAFAASNPIQFSGWRSSSSAGTSVTLTVYNPNGTVCGTATSIANTTTWTTTNYTSGGCTPSAGQVLTFRVTLSVGVNTEIARIGDITLNYLSGF